MTPIARFFSHFLPDRLVFLALCLTYSFMLISVVALFGYTGNTQTLYLDVDGYGR